MEKAHRLLLRVGILVLVVGLGTGLVGTAVSMIRAFGKVAASPEAQGSGVVSAEVHAAFVATGIGLIIAVIGLGLVVAALIQHFRAARGRRGP